MKLFTLVLLCLLLYLPSYAEDLDTVWTHNVDQYGFNSSCVHFMPDGKSIIAGVGNWVAGYTLYEFETATGKIIRKFETPKLGNISSLCISPSGSTIIGLFEGYGIGKWDYSTGKYLSDLQFHDVAKKSSTKFVFHPIENKLFLLVNDTIVLFDITQNKTEKIFKMPLVGATGINISKDGKYLGLSYDYYNNTDQLYHSKLYLFDAINWKIIRELDDITRDVRSIAFSPTSKYVAFTTGQNEGEFLRLYNLETQSKEIYPRGFFGFQPWSIIPQQGDTSILVSGYDESDKWKSKLIDLSKRNSIYTINHGSDQKGTDMNNDNYIILNDVEYLTLLNNRWKLNSVSVEISNKQGIINFSYVSNNIAIKNMLNEIINNITVFDINGKLVKTYDTGYSGATVDLPFSAPAGVYLVRILTDQSDYNFKFVRE